MSANNHIKTTDARDIVKEFAELYRTTEEERSKREDVTHFVANHPELRGVEDVIEQMVT